MYISELSEAKKIELERKYEKEIDDYQNKVICKQKFIYLIKKCNIMEFCYLYRTYIGDIEIVIRFPDIYLEEINSLIETNEKELDSYNDNIRRKNFSYKNPKKLVRIEKMSKNKNYKQYKQKKV